MSRTPTPLYREIAQLVQARMNCMKSGNTTWRDNHQSTLAQLVEKYMPSGSGIDGGTELDLDLSAGDRLVFHFGYHHMNEGGMYDGWTTHTLIVKPSLTSGVVLKISGKDRNGIKDYLYDTYCHHLRCKVWQDEHGDYHSELYGQHFPEDEKAEA